MSATQFLQLCDSFCDAGGTQRPHLVPDRDGMLAFHVTVRGYTATFIHTPQADPADAFVLVDTGPMPPEAGTSTWKSLMQANLAMFGKHAPVFSLNDNEHLMIQLVLPLDKASGQALRQSLLGLADWADGWHATGWRSSAPVPAGPVGPLLMDSFA